MSPIDVASVLDFWFLPRTDSAFGRPRDAWFRKDDAFDASIRARFGSLLDAAAGRTLLPSPAAGAGRDAPPNEPLSDTDAIRADLARVIVCDQFSRNAWRDSARAFSLDSQALVHAGALLGGDRHLRLDLLERWFAYMPLEHAEDRALQAANVALFERLHDDARAAGAPAQVVDAVAGALDYARRHRDVVERFGRFPHRNGTLGRASRPEEVAFLAEPMSSF